MERRHFLGVGAALVVAPASFAKEKDEEAVSPTEDLMREHGVLRRILLVYGEVIRRVDANQPIAAEPIAHAASIVSAFIHDYHERDEEEFIFPRFQKAGKLTDLVGVLQQQHQTGRKLTVEIQQLATVSSLKSPTSCKQLADRMRRFIRMYEPHTAREDTVLFPSFVKLVSEKERHKLMEMFEQKEKSLPLGDFDKMVGAVAEIEKTYGLYDLVQF